MELVFRSFGRPIEVTFYQSWEVIAKVQTKSSEVVVEVAG